MHSACKRIRLRKKKVPCNPDFFIHPIKPSCALVCFKKMNQHLGLRKVLSAIGVVSFVLLACSSQPKPSSPKDFDPDSAFKDYWFNGLAEVQSYDLLQTRYGEVRHGEAVLIFVTEPFSMQTYTKADQKGKNDVSVLKCNFTKRFNTGIYPYSIMTSTFVPVHHPTRGLKISCSVQEWCGHVYTEWLRKKKLEGHVRSYFQGESEEVKLAEDVWCEDDLWTTLRIDPTLLPTGKVNILPSVHLIRLLHLSNQPIPAEANLKTVSNTLKEYVVHYPSLQRTLKVQFSSTFPYTIESWMDTYPDGGKLQTSSGKLRKRIRVPYWQMNRNKDEVWRDSLQLTY